MPCHLFVGLSTRDTSICLLVASPLIKQQPKRVPTKSSVHNRRVIRGESRPPQLVLVYRWRDFSATVLNMLSSVQSTLRLVVFSGNVGSTILALYDVHL